LLGNWPSLGLDCAPGVELYLEAR